MNITRIILSVAVSIVFTMVLLTLFAYLINDELFSNSGSWIGPGKEPWQFKILLTAIYGLIIGAFTGFIICIFDFRIIAGIGFNLLFNLVSIGILFFVLGSDWSSGMTKISCASIIIGIINGAIVSGLNSPQHLE